MNNPQGRSERGPLGEIGLSTPGFFLWPILLVFIISMSACLFLWTFPFSKKMEMQGALRLSEKSVDVLTMLPGIYQSIAVTDGALVKKGQVLAIVGREAVLPGGVSASSSQINILQNDLSTMQRVKALHEEKSSLIDSVAAAKRAVAERDLASYRQQLVTLKAESAKVKEKFNRMKTFYRKGLLTLPEMEAIGAEYQNIKAKRLQAQALIESAEVKLRAIDLERRNNRGDLEQQKAEANSQVEGVNFQIKEMASARTIEIRAPVDGIIAQLTAKVGDAAIQGTRFLTIMPEKNHLIASLFVESKILPFLKNRQRVWLSFEAFAPGQGGLYSGRLLLKKARLMDDELMRRYRINMPTYIVDIKLDRKTARQINNNFPLKEDLPLTSKVPVNQKILWDWITDPIDKQRELEGKKSE